jgi:hypothetical protein
MRTTLNVDDDVLEVAKRTAHIRRISVGEALSEMARQAMNAPIGTRLDPDSGLLVFDVSGPTITSEDVYQMMAEEDLDKYLDQERLNPKGAGRVAGSGRKMVNDKP